MPNATSRMAFAGAGRPEQGQVLGGPDPFQRGQVVQRRQEYRGHGAVELVEGLGNREHRDLEPVTGVGGVAGGDLSLDQGAQELLGIPALRLRGHQQLGASWRMVANFNRRNPSTRSGASTGAVVVMSGPRSSRLRRSRPATGAARPAGPGAGRHRPGGLGGPATGGEERAHIAGAPPAEHDRPVQRGQEHVLAVGGAELVQLRSSALRRVFPAAAAPVMNVSATGPNAKNSFSVPVLGRTARRGTGLGPP
jgi:hypothetical protein